LPSCEGDRGDGTPDPSRTATVLSISKVYFSVEKEVLNRRVRAGGLNRSHVLALFQQFFVIGWIQSMYPPPQPSSLAHYKQSWFFAAHSEFLNEESRQRQELNQTNDCLGRKQILIQPSSTADLRSRH